MAARSWITDQRVASALAAVEQLICDAAGRGTACPRFHRQLLAPGSKLLRPALCLLAARFGRAELNPLLVRAAAGVELLHEATLYHDDIVDEERLRRGQPTAQQTCGPVVAAFAGSELLYASAELLAALPEALRRSLARAVDALCRGQLREIELLGNPETTVRERLRVMRDKTAALFRVAASIGAELGGADRASAEALRRFGHRFGLCFQLADDLKDLTGTFAALGRGPGRDLVDGVYTLPVLYALAGGNAEATALREQLETLRATRASGSVACAATLVESAGGIAKAVQTLAAWAEEARGYLLALEPGDARRSLCNLIDGLQPDRGCGDGSLTGSAEATWAWVPPGSTRQEEEARA